MSALQDSGSIDDLQELTAIGHRVVHGGERFRQPARIDSEVIGNIRDMIPLAPLHNPANLMGIEVAMQVAPDAAQVAVFDTAFHQTLPPCAWHYALPRSLYTEYQVRRYGFHGTSHHYVAKQAADFLGIPFHQVNLITLHLGNGASATAIRNGESIDTSMGMTPLEGLVMGTRCGDIDPAIHAYLHRTAEMSIEETEQMLNRDSGLRGLCGQNDMREVHRLADAGDESASLALDVYCYRLKKYIGAYYAALGRVDAIVFTGGIGENDARIRSRVCSGLEAMGICSDENGSQSSDDRILCLHREDSPVRILVVPTDEELEIAMQTMHCIKGVRLD
jgi:acetate kinase